MECFNCPLCHESIYYDDRVMFYSDVCNHYMCNRCLNSNFGQANRSHCPECCQPVFKSQYREKDIGQDILNSEKEIRRKVLSIYNDVRHHFQNTPEYNDYLEHRESIIYDLTYGCESEKAKIEQELKVAEWQLADRITENAEFKKLNEASKIRDIVEKEGLFYEKVKLALAPKGFVANDDIIHPLKGQYATLFKNKKDETIVIAEGQPKPLNSAIKEDEDLPKRKFTVSEEIKKAEAAGGFCIEAVQARCYNELLACMFLPPKPAMVDKSNAARI